MSLRRFLVSIHDVIMLMIAWVFAIIARYDFDISSLDMNITTSILLVLIPTHLILSWYFGLYKGLWRFASIPDMWILLKVVFLTTVVVFVGTFIINRLDGISRTSLILFPLFAIGALASPRLLYRLWRDRSFKQQSLVKQRPAIVIGGGNAGESIIRDMLREGEYIPVAILDDSKSLKSTKLHGIQVVGSVDQLGIIAEKYSAELIVIAVPSATGENMRAIVEQCERAGVPFRTLPPLHDLVSGRVSTNALREVSIDDLLGREAIKLEWDKIKSILEGKVVLITGGGGSIGSELCRQVARLKPSELIIVEQSEYNLYEIERELLKTWPDLKLQKYLADVRDSESVKRIFSKHKPNVIFHAAAYKHVPMLQDQVREAVFNNVLGTRNVADAAVENNADAFVLISTDKAVNPTNIMGATKRVAEIYCQTLSKSVDTHFITVRFGNVLGSAGSVVPLFQEQIAKGGPLTVTHPDITRYFMTIPEACQLIMQAGTMGSGGEIFVLDMGEPIKITYLAEQVIRLSGLIPGEDIEIKFVGLRPGEKLYEELLHADENLAGTSHPKILLAGSRNIDQEALAKQITKAETGCQNFDDEALLGVIQNLVPELKLEPVSNGDNVISISEHKSS